MAQVVHRVNLSAQSFPFLSELFGRSVIVKGQDQNYVASVTSKEDLDKDIGVPQIYYCHNVMPTANGFQSVGYEAVLSGLPANTDFTSVFLLRDADENKAYFVHALNGKNYILKSGSVSWLEINTIAATGKVTVAHVSGTSYIFFEGVGCYTLNFTTNTLTSVTLTGLTAANIIGIVGAQGYLIAWSTNSVAWSSTLDPTGFVPSLATGAGGGSVEGAQGAINVCVSHTLGFIVFTTENAVAAVYSGNSRFPFNYKAIAQSGGLSSLDLISSDSTSSSYYAYTTSGMQQITTQAATTVMPEVTDFVSGQYFEDFSEITLLLTTQILAFAMQKKLTVVADRYLVVSYGVSELTHALVFDTVQKRWGKLKITHVDCFEYQLLSPTTQEIPRKSLAFLQKDGAIKTVDFSLGSATSSGVVILGKYQYTRTRMLTLENVSVETVKSGATFALYDSYSLDGKSETAHDTGYLAYTGPNSREYKFHRTVQNHSLINVGAFNLSSLVLTFHIHGRR